jgi:hypothetical protein
VWSRALMDAGIGTLPLDADRVLLSTPAGQMTMRLHTYSRALAPSQIPPPPSSHGLLHLPTISHRTMKAVEASGWSVVTDDGQLSLLLDDGTRLRHEPAARPHDEARRSPGPPQYGRFAVVRALLEGGPYNQMRLAHRAGMTQSRVSRLIASLAEQDLVRRTEYGWSPLDWEQLCDWFLSHYQGPGGVTTYWYSLNPLVPAVMRAVKAATAKTDARAGLSGDAAADLVLPWRHPQYAVVYAERGIDLSSYGFTQALSRQDSTLSLIIPKDQGVWPPEVWRPSTKRPDIAVVDPVQVLYDLHTAPGPDAHQAASRWRAALRSRRLPRFPWTDGPESDE